MRLVEGAGQILCSPFVQHLALSCRLWKGGQGVIYGQSPGGGVLPYMGYIGMCRCEGYGFQAVYSRIGYINQSVWV